MLKKKKKILDSDFNVVAFSSSSLYALVKLFLLLLISLSDIVAVYLFNFFVLIFLSPQCKSFLKRATKVKDGLESSQAIEVF